MVPLVVGGSALKPQIVGKNASNRCLTDFSRPGFVGPSHPTMSVWRSSQQYTQQIGSHLLADVAIPFGVL